jgi:hypothetical protein
MANAQVWGWIIGTVILAIASRLCIPVTLRAIDRRSRLNHRFG